MGLNAELSGTLVVSLEQAVAAPYCGLLLADAGARVIKVERPEGDFARNYDKGAEGRSAIFAWLNRGKESICLDLNRPEDEGLLRAMLRRADVLVSNLAPGALARRGFSGEAMRADNPGLITCAITGYGETGAGAKRKAYDFLVQAESGLCSVTGTEDAPSRVGISITDLSAGLTAFSAVLRALIQRARTGEGLDLSVSMFDVMADWMNMPLLGHRYLGGAPARLGLTHALIAPYGAFETGDGSQVLLSIQNDREWAAFCQSVLEAPELATDPRFADNSGRIANRDALTDLLTERFARFDRNEALRRLDAARIANAKLSTVADLSEHEVLRNQAVRFGAAEVSVADLPVRTEAGRAEEVPLLNQHGADIRLEFGASEPWREPSS